MKGVVFFSVFLLMSSALNLSAADNHRILISGDEKKSQIGLAYGNMYSEVAFLNPSTHRTVVKYEEFDQFLPSKDSDNRSTYDEEKAKIRLFFKPMLRTWGTSRRRSYLVGEGRWKLERIENGVKYSRRWKRNSDKINSEIFVRMVPERAEIFVEAVFTNQGRGACQVEFSPKTVFLRDRSLFLMIPRQYSSYANGKQEKFFYGEKVRLDNNTDRNYFWRRESKDDPTGFIDYVSRERIPFNNSKVDRVNVFGFVQLTGKTSLIWDFQKDAACGQYMQYLEFGWEDRLGDAVSAWSLNLKRGESKKIAFRVVTVKGISRFDFVNENIIVGYGVEKNLLRIEMVPLAPLGVSSLTGEVINSDSKQVLIKQKSGIAEMQPFSAGGKNWSTPAGVIFERGTSYPIKMSLSLNEGKSLFDSKGVIVP